MARVSTKVEAEDAARKLTTDQKALLLYVHEKGDLRIRYTRDRDRSSTFLNGEHPISVLDEVVALGFSERNPAVDIRRSHATDFRSSIGVAHNLAARLHGVAEELEKVGLLSAEVVGPKERTVTVTAKGMAVLGARITLEQRDERAKRGALIEAYRRLKDP